MTGALAAGREFESFQNGGNLAFDGLQSLQRASTVDGLRGTVIIVMKQQQFTKTINSFFGMDFYRTVLNRIDPIRAPGSDVYFVLPDVQNDQIHKATKTKPPECALHKLSDPKDASHYDHLLCEFDDILLTMLWRDLLRLDNAVAFITMDKDLIKTPAQIAKFRGLYDKLEDQDDTAVQVNLLKLSPMPV